jgi:hypothetical protein
MLVLQRLGVIVAGLYTQLYRYCSENLAKLGLGIMKPSTLAEAHETEHEYSLNQCSLGASKEITITTQTSVFHR